MQRISEINMSKDNSESDRIEEESPRATSESVKSSTLSDFSEDSEVKEPFQWESYSRQHKLDVNLQEFSIKAQIHKTLFDFDEPIHFFSDMLFEEICLMSNIL